MEEQKSNGGNGSALSVLIVQNGTQASEKLYGLFASRYPALLSSSLAEARQLLQGNTAIAGALIDPNLTDGSGFDLVGDLRGRNISMPILMVTATCDGAMLSRAHLADVPLVDVAHSEENLDAFATQVNTVTSSARGGIDEILAEIALQKRLSLRESQILTVAAHGVPRSHLAKRLGTSENTVKSQIRSLLDKTKQPNLSEAVWLVHSQTERV